MKRIILLIVVANFLFSLTEVLQFSYMIEQSIYSIDEYKRDLKVYPLSMQKEIKEIIYQLDFILPSTRLDRNIWSIKLVFDGVILLLFLWQSFIQPKLKAKNFSQENKE